MTWRVDRVRAFFRLVAERHEMFIRRHLDHKPPPWTDDPILQNLRLTNVYRDLDRATRYLITTTLDRRPALSREALLFNIIVFRSFTKEETYAALGAPYAWPHAAKDVGSLWNAKAALKILRARKRAGERLFTGAYMMTNNGSTRPKHEVAISRLTWVHKRIPKLLQALDEAGSMRAAHKVLRQIPGVGGFVAAELLLDLCYSQYVLLFNLNEWIYAGPGARRGVAHLLGQKVVSQREAETAMRELECNQAGWFKQAGALLHGPSLTISDVENCLCEWGKVCRARAGGHVKRQFHAPRPEGDLWTCLPAKYCDPVFWHDRV